MRIPYATAASDPGYFHSFEYSAQLQHRGWESRGAASVIGWRLRFWLQRSWLAELAGLLTALVCATVCAALTSDELALIVTSTYGSSLSYYVVLLIHEVRRCQLACRALQIPFTPRTMYTTSRNLALEFGVAELLDCLLFTPVLMYLCIQLVPNLQLAVVVSEIASNIAFYATAMLLHEVRAMLLPDA